MVFPQLWEDLLVSSALGMAGGLGLDFLQTKGFQLPSIERAPPSTDGKPNTGGVFVNLGSVAPIGIGALAAPIAYATNQPSNAAKLVGAAIIAGLGGTGILSSYIKDKAASQAADNAEAAQSVANAALQADPNTAEGQHLQERITALEQSTLRTRQRWGIR